jgi:TRAP-type C4-dicarboxylate transport system permease small subunit
LLVVLLGGLVLFASAQIVLRNVFSISVNWGDGLTRLAVFWLALIGALAAGRDGRHITMEALGRWLPARVQIAAGMCADVFAAAFCGVFAWFALMFVRDSRSYGDTVLSGIPAWWAQLIMPIAFALLAYRFALHAVARLRRR